MQGTVKTVQLLRLKSIGNTFWSKESARDAQAVAEHLTRRSPGEAQEPQITSLKDSCCLMMKFGTSTLLIYFGEEPSIVYQCHSSMSQEDSVENPERLP
ncbi:hypothetical protein NPIL_512561 [Nephila pilipes]|uniref:Uncharacterized protein n=1 Tax=Nephila pilipes TaxID=299642 RepID=A0A8X6QRR1_NEPPI|nr:hypothetical protein NPIL_512561 [Nephila pilipes]